MKPPDQSWERREFASPDGLWTLVFHSHFEWRMGWTGWKGSLYCRGRDVTAEHKDVFTMSSGKGFPCDSRFQPWSYDSTKLVLLTYEDAPIWLYEIATKSVTVIDAQEKPPYNAQWSPDTDRLIVTYQTGGVLYDHTGKPCGFAPWNIGMYEESFVYWVKPGVHFFSVGRQNREAKTQITFFRGDDGFLLDACDLDPADLVPYDVSKYAQMPRRQHCLISASGTRTIGFHLDVWNEVRFDQASNILSLCVYRPVSDPSGDDRYMVCDVEERWISAEVAI